MYCVLSLQFCLTLRDPWTLFHQASLYMGFSRQEYWSGFQFLAPEDLPTPGTEPISPRSLALASGCLPLVKTGKPLKKERLPFFLLSNTLSETKQ